jgi:hypothetical protein
MGEALQDQDFLETMVKSIVSYPDEVSVERTVDEMGVLLTLKVHPDDMGYIIGRRGQTIQSIRNLLKVLGAQTNARINLKIHDPNQEGQNQNQKQNESSSSNESSEEVDTSSVDDLKI